MTVSSKNREVLSFKPFLAEKTVCHKQITATLEITFVNEDT